MAESSALNPVEDAIEVLKRVGDLMPDNPAEEPPVVVGNKDVTHPQPTDEVLAPDSRITFHPYEGESVLPEIMKMMAKDLSEPYSIYTYRYFLHQWPDLCILAYDPIQEKCVGSVVCRAEGEPNCQRGYIAMLAVHEDYRRKGIASELVKQVVQVMQEEKKCIEVGLETEVTNANALKLYSKLGFIKESRMRNYYLNGVDAFKLKLPLPVPQFENQAQA